MVKHPPAHAGDIGDTGSILRLRRSSGGGHGNPLQYSCLKKPVDRGAWQAHLSMGFSRLEYWSGLPCPPPEDLPDPRIEPGSPALQADSFFFFFAGGFFTPEPQGKAKNTGMDSLSLLQGKLLDPGIELGSPALKADSLLLSHQGRPLLCNLLKVGQITRQICVPLSEELPCCFPQKAHHRALSSRFFTSSPVPVIF